MHEARQVPCSLGQERIWLLTRLHGAVPALHERGGAWLDGEVELADIEAAAREIARRHEILRTIIREEDGQPLQVIAPEPELRLREVDLCGEDARSAEERALQVARDEVGVPFDLEHGPLWRLCVIRIHGRRRLLVLTMHHLVSDGDRSVVLFFQELLQLLRARARGEPANLPPCPLQIAEHARWEREQLEGALMEEQLAFWRSELAGAPTFLDLPVDRPRPAVQTFAGASVERTLPPAVVGDLRALCEREGADLFAALAAGLFAVLHRYSGQDDVLVGTPLPGREHPAVQGLLGYFGNPVVLRGRLADDPPFRALLRQARQTAELARANGQVSFKDVVEAAAPPRDLSRPPLFQVLFSLREPLARTPPDDGLALTQVDVELPFVAYDQMISAQEIDAGLLLRVEYNSDLFDEATAAGLLLRWEILLCAAAAAPETRISALPLLREDERRRILVEWNETRTNYPRDACIHELFEAQARRGPEAVAVLSGEEELTYGELDRRADRVARRLMAEGVGPETPVGILAERSAEVIIGMLGILKAGGAYVPLDPEHPPERLQFMLEEAGASILLTSPGLSERLPFQGRVIDLAVAIGANGFDDQEPLRRQLTASSLAYIMFTSGSTGRPKGVMVPHRGVVRLVVGTDYVTFTPQDRVLLGSNLSFDTSTFEIWGALLNGARLCPASKETLLSPGAFAAQIHRQGINVIFLATALFQQLAGAIPDAFGAVDYLVVGGDALPPGACRDVLAKAPPKHLVNGYGPTENTTFSTAQRVREVAPGAVRIPIGRPIANSTAYILDPHLQPVPVGVPGELYVGGDGLALGYRNRPDVTAERFVKAPFFPDEDVILYRTGDRARYLPDGAIDFLGRVDRQVKIRGFRVEPAEVESVLREHTAVRDVAVVVREDAPGDKRLVGYVSLRSEGAPSASELRDFLRQKLPDFLVPAAIVLLPELPLTPNGKLDHGALPAPTDALSGGAQSFVAPRSGIEQELASIWQQVLHVDRVGVHDDFFALGGHSLRATQVVGRIRQKLGIDLSLRQLFGHPTIAALADLIEGELTEHAPTPPMTTLPRGGVAPLSFAQEQLWFLHQLAPESRAYHYPGLFRLRGRLDVPALERALQELVRRHEPLRTRFADFEGRPVQVISAHSQVELAVVDIGALPAREREEQVRERMSAEARRRFDLRRGPLLRATLLRIASDDHALALVLHHIVTDGWSMGLLYGELEALYGAFQRGQPSPLEALPIQYADYALWQRRWSEEQAHARQLAFWRERLAGAPTVFELPADRPRPLVQTFRGGEVPLRVGGDCAAAIRALSAREGATPTMVLLAAFFALLHRYTGQEDILVGLTHANRQRAETEAMIGLFVNTLVLRGDLSGEPTFRELLARVRAASVEAQDNADVPFEQIVAAVDPGRDLSRNPLVQVMFAPQPSDRGGLRLSGVAVEHVDLDLEKANCDLTWFVREEPEGFAGTLEFSSDLFDRETIAQFAGHLQTLLAGAIEAPDTPIWKLPLLSAEERCEILFQWNDTRTPYPRDLCVHEVFEAVAERTPDAIAATCKGEQISYGELDRRADLVARRLVAEGVGPGTPVGVALERSLEMLVGLLGILKAGGAFVPLDPDHPKERLELMLHDSGAPVLLTTAAWVGRLAFPGKTVDLASVGNPSGEPPVEVRARRGVTPSSLAYIMFTSGSTGRPKGVAVPHRGIVRLVMGADYVALGPSDRLSQTSNLCFDTSMFEIWGALLHGARLSIITKEDLLAHDAFAARVREEGINVMFLSTALFHQMAGAIPETFRGLDYLIVAGEALHPGACHEVLVKGPPRRLVNAYGPTENATFSTAYHVQEICPGAAGVPIGRPIANSTAYILDPHLSPVPAGVPGEIYVGGDGLALGYINRPELTAQRFIESPLPEAPGVRLYRTGDRGRYLRDGNIEFLGRMDDQVKIRGIRVEPGEVEVVLREHPAVRDAAVRVREDSPGERRLVAYVVPRSEPHPSASLLRDALRQRLPEAMIPSAFVLMSALPLTPNGKVDHRALPAPGAPEVDSQHDVAAPGTAVEQALAEIWHEVLGLPQVGIDSPFFDVGGHSLLLAQVRARIRERLGQELDMLTLFQCSTIRKLAAHLSGAMRGDVPGAASVDRGSTSEPPRAPTSLRNPTTTAVSASIPPKTAAAEEPECIAIVGMAGRFPGADDVEALWRLLKDGLEGISRFTPDELLAVGLDPKLVGTLSFVPAAGVLRGALDFDTDFFGLSPKDAQLMDPQHRLFLECAWEALESAGYDPGRAPSIGVFGGCGAPHYWIDRVAALGIPRGSAEEYRALTGNGQDFLATRVAYKLGLRGPALSVQTACSTSLVAVHLACQSLLSRHCDMALAGGVSLFSFDEGAGYVHEDGGILSPDGHCRPFDSEARGTVPGSGVGVVVLKRLEDALKDGDTIRAIIRASAINNDGSAKVGYTAPSVEGQEEVIARAHAAAGVSPETIGYVEAHGTATPLGDPIEVAALTRAFRRSTSLSGYCVLGSVKGNLGHLDAAAGVTGLIKAALVLERRFIPATLHFRRPNPGLALESSPFLVSARSLPWMPGDGPRRAAVSSFGMGGTNAHAVLEEAPELPASGPSRRSQLLVLSARSPAALDAMRERLAAHLRAESEQPLADVAHTLQQGRAAFAHRVAVVCATAEEGADALQRGDRGRFCRGVAGGRAPKMVFMFPGVGTQQSRMGLRLYARERAYREALDRCVFLFRHELDADIRALIMPPDDELAEASARLLRPSLNMAAILSTEIALAELLRSWGLRPAAVTGHSLGEYAAAYLAGVLRLEDAVALVALRGQLLDEIPGVAMLSVPLPEAVLRKRLGGGLSIAAINGPESCVVSGARDAVELLCADLALEGIEARRIPVAMASHSPLVEAAARRLSERAATMRLRVPRIPVVSNVTGGWMTEADACDPGYWGRHLTRTVRFADGITTLLRDPDHALVEVGPGKTLAALARMNLPAGAERLIVSTMAHAGGSRDDLEALLHAIGQLWCAGVEIDWQAFSQEEKRHRVPLPTYPFERTTHVIEASQGMKRRPAVALQRARRPAVAPLGVVPAYREERSGAGRQVDALEAAVAEIWRDLLGIPDVRACDNFFDLGGSSLVAVQMRVAVRERLEVDLPIHALLEHPTFGSLLELVRGARAIPLLEGDANRAPASAAAARLMVRIQEGSPERVPLFWVQPVGGTVYTYMELARQVGTEYPVYAFRASGMEPGEPLYREIPALATRFLEELLAVQPCGPYLLGGHSAGGTTAYEMACQLEARGHGPVLVWMADSGPTPQYERMSIADADQLIEALAAFRDIAPEMHREYVRVIAQDPLLRSVIVANYQALASYEPARTSADVVYLRARERDSLLDQNPETWWMDRVDGPFTMHNAPGNHMTMMEVPHLTTLARLVRLHVDRAANPSS